MHTASKTSTQDPSMNELVVLSASPSSEIVCKERVDAQSDFKGESSSSASEDKPRGADNISFSDGDYSASRNPGFLEDGSKNEEAKSEVDELISIKNRHKDENFNEVFTKNLESSGVIYIEGEEWDESEKKNEEGATTCSGVVPDNNKGDSKCKTVDESYSNTPKPGCSEDQSRNSLASLKDFSFLENLASLKDFDFKRSIVFSSTQDRTATRNPEFLEDDSRNEVKKSEIDELTSYKNLNKDENFNEFMTHNLGGSGAIYVEGKEREESEKKTKEGATACSDVVSNKIKRDSECKTVDESYSNTPKPGCSKDRNRNSPASLKDFSFLESLAALKDLDFERGIVFSSTPHSVLPLAKRRRLGADNLSAIKEEVESGGTSEDSNTPAQTDEIKEPSPIECTFSHSHKPHCPLTKDEISMVFDLPDGPLNQNENSAVEKNDVTIKLNKGQSIVYADVRDKRIDEVILDGDHEIDFIKVEREPDKSRILQKAKELKVFISENDQENKDNFDPEWEAMRKLETDDERYKAVRKLWMNLNIPDPKENLSSFNWRKRNNLGPPKCNPIEDINCLASKGTFPCTEVFDVANKKLVDLYEKRMRGFAVDGNYERAVLTSRKRSHPNAMGWGNGQFLDQLYECVQEKIYNNEHAKKEIEAIHKFYNGLRNRSEDSNNLMRLTYRERQEILDVEEIITSYSHWYKC